MPVIGLIIALGSMLAKYISVEVLRFVAMRALLLSLVVVILPIVIETFLTNMFESSMSLMSSTVSGTNLSGIVPLTGVFGWVGQMLKLPEALSVVLSAVSLRFALNMIPFVRV